MDKDLTQKILESISKYPEIALLMLFGSRARDDATADSDWDFADSKREL